MFTKYRLAFICINLGLAVAALVYDIPAISHIPWYAVPFVVVCPIYPFLIALTLASNRPHPLLQSFATIPASVYGGLALCFYPLHMALSGLSWYGIGQMLWVLLYASQALFLLPRKHSAATFAAAGFTVFSLCVHLQTGSYGYLDIASLSETTQINLFLVGLVLVGVVAGVIKHYALLDRSQEVSERR